MLVFLLIFMARDWAVWGLIALVFEAVIFLGRAWALEWGLEFIKMLGKFIFFFCLYLCKHAPVLMHTRACEGASPAAWTETLH